MQGLSEFCSGEAAVLRRRRLAARVVSAGRQARLSAGGLRAYAYGLVCETRRSVWLMLCEVVGVGWEAAGILFSGAAAVWGLVPSLWQRRG